MAIGVQFSSLIADLKVDARHTSSASASVDGNAQFKRAINRNYSALLADYDWPHLEKVTLEVQLAAGQRLYSLPSGLSHDGARKVSYTDGSAWGNVQRGISAEEYASLDPFQNERQDPPRRWDIVFSDTAVELEVWPTPASNQYKLKFEGPVSLPKLVNDTDKCWLDDELVLAFAAADMLKARGAEDADDVRENAQRLLNNLQGKSQANRRGFRIGLGETDTDRTWHPTIRINPSSGS